MKDLEMDLFELFEKLIQYDQENQRRVAHQCHTAELTECQCRYLKILDANEPLTSGQFAQLICVSKPTVSQLINRFIEDGYVVKEGCPHDKRSCYIRMTDKGREAARVDKNARIEVIRILAPNLTEQEKIQLIELLYKLLDYKEEK